MPSPAPVAAGTPAPAASVPVVETTPINVLDATDQQLAERYGVKDETPEEPQVEIVRDDDPKAAAPAAPETPKEPEAPAPETPKAPAVIAAPITPFAVFDAEGEVEIPNITLTFTAGKKEYAQVPLDKVVRMAQAAPLAEQYRTEAERVPVLEQTLQEREQAIRQREADIQQNNALYEKLLTNPDLYVQAVEAYQRLQSPEARAERAEREMQSLRQQQQQFEQQRQAQQSLTAAQEYAQSTIVPAITALTQQYASVIDAEEFQDRFHTLTADLLEAGPHGRPWVPPTKLPEVERRVQTDLTQWAEAKAAKRRQSQTAATAQVSEQVSKAQQDAQAAKRQLARVTAPARTAVAPDVPREKPIRTAQDAVDASLEKVRRMVTQGSAA